MVLLRSQLEKAKENGKKQKKTIQTQDKSIDDATREIAELKIRLENTSSTNSKTSEEYSLLRFQLEDSKKMEKEAEKKICKLEAKNVTPLTYYIIEQAQGPTEEHDERERAI
jgi:chromosome segregation ATPase